MKSNEEKIKEFFKDEEKVKEFMKDEEFMSKVSDGTATAQTYIDEFKKFDINLTKKEAEGIFMRTEKLLSIPVEKLNDEAVSNVVGGGSFSDAAKTGAITTGVMAGASAVLFTLPLGVATLCYAHKAKKAGEAGNIEEEKRCTTLKKQLINLNYFASGTFGVLSLVGGLVMGGVGLMYGEEDDEGTGW